MLGWWSSFGDAHESITRPQVGVQVKLWTGLFSVRTMMGPISFWELFGCLKLQTNCTLACSASSRFIVAFEQFLRNQSHRWSSVGPHPWVMYSGYSAEPWYQGSIPVAFDEEAKSTMKNRHPPSCFRVTLELTCCCPTTATQRLLATDNALLHKSKTHKQPQQPPEDSPSRSQPPWMSQAICSCRKHAW